MLQDYNMPKIVIIGASIAGHTVAAQLRELDKECGITLLTEESFPLYDRRKLTDLLAGTVKEKDLFLADEDFYLQRNIAFLKEKKVSTVNQERKTVYFKERGTLDYDFLIIASGRKAEPPEVPGAKKKGVFCFNSLSDYKEFSQQFIGHPICVSGSDDAALTLAKALADKYKVEVRLLSRNAFDPALLIPQIEVVNSAIQEIIGEGEVQAVKLQDGKAIGVCAVIFLETLKGSIEFLKNINVELIDGCIAVDEAGRTGAESIFACGAVARLKGSEQKIKNWDDAIAEGTRVAHALIKQMKGETCQTY